MKNTQTDPPVGAGAARERVLLLGVQLALLAPFLAKPIHIDDTFFLAIGRHIAESPLDPFGFDYNWAGTAASVWHEMKNPPGLFYLHAGLQQWFGSNERVLHAVFWLFPVCATQATYSLARRLTARPLYPAVLLAACPAFWVSATSLMLDVPVVAAMTAALLAGAIAQERDGFAPRLAAGLAASVATLIKYFGLAVAPLLAAHAWWAGRLRARDALSFGLPLVVFAVWWGFGGGHFGQAMDYRAEERADLLGWSLTHGFAGMTFVGGLLAFPVVMLFDSLVRPSERGQGMLALALGIAAGTFHAVLLPDGLVVNDLLAGVLAGSGALFVVRSLLERPEDALRRTVLLWLAGGLAFALVLNWTLNARTVALFAPPAVLVFAWQTEGRRILRAVALALTVLVGSGVALSDAELAAFGPQETARVERTLGGSPVQFAGHWGFQHYMEAAGYEHVDLANPELPPGSVLVAPLMHQVANGGIDSLPFLVRVVYERPRRLPIAVMDPEAGAGLHGSFLGLLPFAYSTGPIERVAVLRW